MIATGSTMVVDSRSNWNERCQNANQHNSYVDLSAICSSSEIAKPLSLLDK